MIQIENLTKKYGKHAALSEINFTVNEGEVLAFLGPNGAGKSTTMNIITGYLSPTEGTVKIDGFDILEQPEEAKKRIGYLPEIPPLYMDMTVYEYLKFVANIKKVPKAGKEKAIKSIMELIRIKDVSNRLIKNLSKGYKQRVGIAQALIGDPKILILDEPTVGLDPKEIIEIRNLIKELGEKHTIILSSHILAEVSTVCDRIVIINKGKIVACDTPENLSSRLNQGNSISIRVKASVEAATDTLNTITDISSFSIDGEFEEGTVDIIVNGNEDTDIRETVFNAFAGSGQPILIMKPLSLSLEEIFLQVTDGKLDTSEGTTSESDEINEADVDNTSEKEEEDVNADHIE